MDNAKTGSLIRTLRQQLGLTQRQLADRLMLSDRTVSKWERGLGAPEVSLLPEVADALGVSIDTLLSGALAEQDPVGGSLRKSRYFYCKTCGGLTVSTGAPKITCCGRRLEEARPQKAPAVERLVVEQVEDEWYLTSGHPMTKEHHIAFVALATGERLQVVKCWPEWDLQIRLPRRGHGLLLWYCTCHGLFSQIL